MTDIQVTATGRFATEKASRYLQQLCKHFGHKVDVEFDAQQGRVVLLTGPASLLATDGELQVTVTGPDAAGVARAKGIIDSHLGRFAFREDFKSMSWD